MRCFDGETLENYVARKGCIPLPQVKFITRSIAERLLIFQRFGYCCRNLSPSNILLCKDSTVRITGFFPVEIRNKSYDVQRPYDCSQIYGPRASQ